MQNAGVNEAKARIKGDRRNINNFRHGDDTTLMAESEELKSLLMKGKEESEKAGLKFNIQKTLIQTTNLKNVQATYAAQFQKNKRPNQKMGQRTK